MSDELDETEILAAEYVLGTLDREERRRAQVRLATDPGFARIVDGLWANTRPARTIRGDVFAVTVTLGWRFNADRMVMDYVRECYIPAAGSLPSTMAPGMPWWPAVPVPSDPAHRTTRGGGWCRVPRTG